VAPEALRENATLVAWVGSSGGVRERESIEFEALSRDSREICSDEAYAALDVAVGELMIVAL
jgi:hypothetical protein